MLTAKTLSSSSVVSRRSSVVCRATTSSHAQQQQQQQVSRRRVMGLMTMAPLVFGFAAAPSKALIIVRRTRLGGGSSLTAG